MIICSNCGATNNEANTNICRKCGALLPISKRTPRVDLSSQIQSPKQPKSINMTIQEIEEKPSNSDLQEIPKIEDQGVLTEKLTKSQKNNEIPEEINISDYEEEVDKEFLKEITPTPFRGSIIAAKGVYGFPSRTIAPNDVRATQKGVQETPVVQKQDESGLIKQKQLEQDMTKVLKFLSRKVTVKKLPNEIETEKQIEKEKEETLPPASMNEILKDLEKLDLHIEASAIIKTDGTILASAISSRISDSLFATIGQNLSMIGTDIIEGLSAGRLRNISVRGTKGVLDVAPITDSKDMLLIIFSNPKVKSGIIYLAVNVVKKQVKEYLGLMK
jgi:predicted regulator of Ras-like GTPase activity (Roadblock/LC7/MglB family)/ribosomal protein L40E